MRIAIIGLLLVILSACGSGKKDVDVLQGMDTVQTEGPSISKEVIAGILLSQTPWKFQCF